MPDREEQHIASFEFELLDQAHLLLARCDRHRQSKVRVVGARHARAAHSGDKRQLREAQARCAGDSQTACACGHIPQLPCDSYTLVQTPTVLEFVT